MTIDITYPVSWSEISREQLLLIASQMLKKRTREEFLFELFCRLTGLRLQLKPGVEQETMAAQYNFVKGKQKFFFPVTSIRTACEELSFILEGIGLPECPILSLNTKLHGVSFRQYYFADAYFRRYQQTKQISYFFSMYEALTGIKIKKMQPHEVMAITIWWTGLKDFFKGKYPNVLKDGQECEEQKTPADTLQEILSVLNNNKPQENERLLACEVNSVLLALDNIYQTNTNANH
jgi:hypothetical protein